jgi:hypothetical protein
MMWPQPPMRAVWLSGVRPKQQEPVPLKMSTCAAGCGWPAGGGRRQRGFQIVGRVAWDVGPNLGGGGADALAVGLGARAGHADGDAGQGRLGLLAQGVDGGEMLRQGVVVQEAEVGRSEFGAQAGFARRPAPAGRSCGCPRSRFPNRKPRD